MEKTLVILPAHNEAASIKGLVERLRESFSDVVVVDDGSRDETARIARAAGAVVLSLPFNQGYGVALQTGYKYARENGYTLLAQIDADGQHDPIFINEMLAHIRGGAADIVIGSRFLIDNGYRAPFVKRLGMRIHLELYPDFLTGGTDTKANRDAIISLGLLISRRFM